MRITESQLRRIIRQEVRSLRSGRPLREARSPDQLALELTDLIASSSSDAIFGLVDQISNAKENGERPEWLLQRVLKLLMALEGVVPASMANSAVALSRELESMRNDPAGLAAVFDAVDHFLPIGAGYE